LGGFREVDINLNVASLVKEDLVAQGYDVDLLAEFDPRLNDYHALALISIHADSCEYINDQATGFKVSAAMSTKYPEQVTRLTNCLRNRYAAITGLSFHSGSVTADMSEYHAFNEINPDTPAAIIETGFMNLDREILTQHPDVIAQGIASGILCYVRNEDINATQVP
jgi:N-acetylmuramoyl-L-alanine amidase